MARAEKPYAQCLDVYAVRAIFDRLRVKPGSRCTARESRELVNTAVALRNQVTKLKREAASGQKVMDFDANARTDDPETSKAAAEAISGERVSEMESAVLQVLIDAGEPLTSWQIAQRGELEYGSTSPRLVGLEEKGKVRRGAEVEVEGRQPSIQWELI